MSTKALVVSVLVSFVLAAPQIDHSYQQLSSQAVAAFKPWSAPGKFATGERIYNLCPADVYDPILVSNNQICLHDFGIGTLIDGQCHFFNAATNTQVTIPESDVVCRIENRPGLAWFKDDDIASGVLNKFSQAIVRLYITGVGGMKPDYLLCRATVGGIQYAGYAPMLSNGNDKGLPASTCIIHTGMVAEGNFVEWLVMTTDLSDQTLWPRRTAIQIDPAGGLLNEGVYTLHPTIDECEWACLKLPQCGGYLWYRQGGWCWLKIKSIIRPDLPQSDQKAAYEFQGSADDGARGRLITDQERPTYDPQQLEAEGVVDFGGCQVQGSFEHSAFIVSADGAPNAIFQPNGKLQVNGVTAAECCQMCRDHPDCNAINYRMYENQCYLNRGAAPFQFDQCGDSVIAVVPGY